MRWSLRAAVSALLAGAGVLRVAAAAQRWWPACKPGDFDADACIKVQDHLYDYLALEDGRLAVVVGDVTGHGIDAAADMAMAKYVFRSLAREHPEPADFLAATNDVVGGEIAPGKFITMLYLLIDPETGTIRCGCAGHPPPRLVDAAYRGFTS